LLLKFLGFIFRKQNEIERLTGSLQIDISNTKTTLNWTPSLSVEEGIRRMIEGK
jgi:UDP-glucose 4-epimerase